MAKSSKKRGAWAEIGSAAIGATIGGVLGMLFAPQSGKKTRQAIATEGKKLVKDSTKAVQKVKKEVEEAVAKKTLVKPVKKSVRKVVTKSK